MEIVEVLRVGAEVIGAAAAVTAIVPGTATLPKWLKVVRQVLDLLAMNVGNAKNR